jgi:hypothetical protein
MPFNLHVVSEFNRMCVKGSQVQREDQATQWHLLLLIMLILMEPKSENVTEFQIYYGDGIYGVYMWGTK